ncbi:hypothetical protein D3C77_472230 [compost metagenome]
MAEGVEDLKIGSLPRLAFGVDEKTLPLAKETRLDPSLVKARVVEVTQHVLRRGIAHGPAVIGVLPLFCLFTMAAKAGGRGNVTLTRTGLRSRLGAGLAIGPDRQQAGQQHHP